MDIINYYTAQDKADQNRQVCPLSDDPIAEPFKLVLEQQARLLAAKKETLAHSWIREAHGKLELEPLDDDFKKLQAEIAELEAKINQNKKVIAELSRIFERFEINYAALQLINRERSGLITDIETAKRKSNSVGMQNLPEATIEQVQTLNANKIDAWQKRLAELDKWLEAINTALAECEA